MVKIRLQRMGAKNKPQYVVVATQETAPRDGKYLEKLGFFFPHAKGAERIKLDTAKIQAWKAKGAQVSETVAQLVKTAAAAAK